MLHEEDGRYRVIDTHSMRVNSGILGRVVFASDDRASAEAYRDAANTRWYTQRKGG